MRTDAGKRRVMRKLIGNGRPDLFENHLAQADSKVAHEFDMDSLVIYGTSVHVTEKIVALREQVGTFGMHGRDWADAGLPRTSMDLMAREVMPALNQAIGEEA